MPYVVYPATMGVAGARKQALPVFVRTPARAKARGSYQMPGRTVDVTG